MTGEQDRSSRRPARAKDGRERFPLARLVRGPHLTDGTERSQTAEVTEDAVVSLAPLRSATGAVLIAATVLASGITSYNASVVNVAVPAIGRHFGASVAAIQWTLTSYLLAVAALLLVAGALADRLGRRRVLMIGLGVMFAASIVCAWAPCVGVLIAGRAIQGIGAALVTPTSLALLNGTLRKSDRARGIGVWAGLETLVASVGPYAGGWLVDQGSWRWVFVLNLPLIVLALLAVRRVPESVGERRPGSLDLVGPLLTILGLGGFIYALTDEAGAGWSSPQIVVALVVGTLALLALIPTERRRPAPMLRLSLFSSRQFDAINVTTVLIYGALAAASYLVAVQLELKLGYSAAQAGAALIPVTLVFFLLAPLSGALVKWIGARWLMVTGILLIAGSQLWLAQVHSGSHYVEAILPAALLRGVGLGLMVTPLTAAVLAAVGDSDLGEASAINDAAARVGAVVAIALVPLLIGVGVGSSLDDALTHGYRQAMIAIGGLCLAGAIVAWLFASDKQPAVAAGIAAPATDPGRAIPAVEKGAPS
jgi:EmrB/QacA subfamily drug resistance transporter